MLLGCSLFVKNRGQGEEMSELSEGSDVLLSEGDWSLLLEAAFIHWLCYWYNWRLTLASVLIESAEILLLKVRKGFWYIVYTY